MHNYAKPMTEEARLARVLQRLPADWSVAVERPADGVWRVRMHKPAAEPVEAQASTFVDALEEVWRALR